MLWSPLPKRPGTPIRWLCLKAFQYQKLLSQAPLSAASSELLNQALELGVFLNRCFDGKANFSKRTYRTLRDGLPSEPLRQYLRELRDLEQNRFRCHDWESIHHYRREVLRVSLQLLSRLAGVKLNPVLLELCSLIQLADDLIDHNLDQRLSLPTFLAAGAPHPARQALIFWSNLVGSCRTGDAPFLLGGWVALILALALSAVWTVERVFDPRP